jgi:hypothetical protein
MKLKLTPGYSALQSGFLPTRSTGTDKEDGKSYSADNTPLQRTARGGRAHFLDSTGSFFTCKKAVVPTSRDDVCRLVQVR